MNKNKFFIIPIVMILAVVYVFINGSAFAGPMVLDTNFSGDGIFTHDGAAGGSGADDMAMRVDVQSDGKYFISGRSINGAGDPDMTLWRLNSDGTLDTTFDTDGIQTHDNAAGGNDDDRGHDFQIQSDGKYIVSGHSGTTTPGARDMAIWRYNSDGSLDTTFNTVGYFTHNSAAGGNHDDFGDNVRIQSDGKYVVAGSSINIASGHYDVAIWRLNTDGTLDTTFDTDGIVTHTLGVGNDSSFGMEIQSDGKYVLVGRSVSTPGNEDVTVWRFNTDGSLDTSFDTDGYAVFDNAAGGSGEDRGYGLALQSDGKILVSGYSTSAADGQDMVLYRLNTNGSLDTTFDTDGYLTDNGAGGGSSHDNGADVQVQGDGKIVVTGQSITTNGDYDMIIWRFNTDGSFDTTFDDDGILTHNNAAGGSHNDQGASLLVLSDGKYMVAGQSRNASLDRDMAVWKFNELITDEDTAGIEVNVADVIALDCGADVDFGTVTPGTPVTAETTCTATTNAEAGYTLQVKREDVDTTMDHTTDDTSNITDKAAWTSGTPNATTAIDDVLGFGVYASTATKNTTWWGTGTACDDASNNYAGFPSAYDTIMTHSTYSATGTTTSVCYKVDLPSSQKSGSYDGVVIYQVYTNP